MDFFRVPREHFACALRNRKNNPDDGGLLVEVLVAMLILVVVFTTTSIALADMADQRLRIEQRDRALAILTSYEEQSRVFRCGFVIDRIDDSLTLSRTPGSGTAQFTQNVDNCDFAAAASTAVVPPPAANAGDQDFQIRELVRQPNSYQTFSVKIRYWWESPGSAIHGDTCPGIQNAGANLPLILTRAFEISWDEEGTIQTEQLIKRDPIPTDSVVFASGNRVNILVDPGPVGENTYVTFAPVIGPFGTTLTTKYIVRHIDGLLGQPRDCVWFPYITVDGGRRHVSNDSTPDSSLNVIIPADQAPQTFVLE